MLHGLEVHATMKTVNPLLLSSMILVAEANIELYGWGFELRINWTDFQSILKIWLVIIGVMVVFRVTDMLIKAIWSWVWDVED